MADEPKQIAFERAIDIAADELARCRLGYDAHDVEPTENERLLAGHIIGRLWANDLLNTAGENWVTVRDDMAEIKLADQD